MLNERITENIVRNLLREKGYYNDDNIVIEEQSSRNPKIDKLLKIASKSGKGGGRPEFIISFRNNPDDLIIVECKASILQHESRDRASYKDYAVDGVLLYASYLKDSFNITAIAVSGENEREKKISTFLWLKEHYTYKDIQDGIFLTASKIGNIIKEQSKPFAEEELIAKAIDYNSLLHNYSIPEVERCTLISAILIALQHEPFLKSYKYYTSNKELIGALLKACESVLKQNNLDIEKIEVIRSEYSKFKNNNDFNSSIIYNKKTKKDEVNTLLRDFILSINQDILPHIQSSEFDVLGKFYTQFIKYAGNDKKTGLVLTPSHITDFFCDIAELSVNDVVFDPCCGTAGFLVSAMNYMLKKAGHDTEKQKQIKSNQLIGIEKRADMFSHACSNMMMRGDGKSHILYGNCFDETNKSLIKEQKPTKGFLNPPYQDGNADEQLEFIENTLECLVKDGICIAICQMSTVVSADKKVNEVKKRLLQKHTLEAVFSMPNDLFHPVGVNTCIIVFKAHNTHPSNKKTFFGYFKDDGFVKQKNKGRVDKELKWQKIKMQWVGVFINKENIQGLSIMQIVNAEMEWCAEAYMETDYGALTEEDFVKTVKDYVAFKVKYDEVS
jgi:type I restriction enzyme M protein